MQILKENLRRRVYVRPLDEVKVDIFFYNNDVWLSQREISLLYGVQILTIRKHLRNAYKKEKLVESKVTATLVDSVNTEMTKTVYNLQAINNIGHRIDSSLVLKFNDWLEKERVKQEAKEDKE